MPNSLIDQSANSSPQTIHEPVAGSRRWSLTRVAWVPLAVFALAVLVLAIPGYLTILPEGPHAERFVVQFTPHYLALTVLNLFLSIGVAALSILLGWTLHQRKGHEPMALFLAYYLLAHGALVAGPAEALDYLIPGIARMTVFVLQPFILLPMSFALFGLFPDGHFVPNWTRWLVLASAVVGIFSIVLVTDGQPQLDGTPAAWLGVGWVGLAIAMLYAQIYRYRRVSSVAERQQTKWFVYGVFLWFALMAVSSIGYFSLETLPVGSQLPWWAPFGTLLWVLSTATLPVSLTVAVMRHRLYDIDLIINRTLVYGGLTAIVAGVYVLVVGGLGWLLQASGSLLISLIGTGLVAVLLNPLRASLQGAVNRWSYGQRDDPAAVLDHLSHGMQSASAPQDLLETITATITDMLKVPSAKFELAIGSRRFLVSRGQPTEGMVKFPLSYQAERLGRLVVGRRAAGEEFSEQDNMLLRQIAGQAVAAVYAMCLAQDLRAVRAGLVAAREEERRRLRRDLHDGLGPALASQGLKLAAARQLLKGQPRRAQALLDELATQNEATVAEIRRLVYDLRPPALDELGLLGALNDFAMDGNRAEGTGLKVQVRPPAGGLPILPAAVEVAGYRIVSEAITNAARHAQARNCVVSVAVESTRGGVMLLLEVLDDGRGMPQTRRSGVGLQSMRERAEEIGGRLEITSSTREGTRVQAWLPLAERAV